MFYFKYNMKKKSNNSETLFFLGKTNNEELANKKGNTGYEIINFIKNGNHSTYSDLIHSN